MSFFEDLFEVFEGKRRRGHHDGQNYGHHNRHSYDNHHDHYAHEDYQKYQNSYENREWLICPQCSAKVQPDAKFCNSCGARMDSNRNCPGCGSKIQVNSTFCSNCGRKVNGQE
jgi:predicted nucleic acid-binding Zn ribbon protein